MLLEREPQTYVAYKGGSILPARRVLAMELAQDRKLL